MPSRRCLPLERYFVLLAMTFGFVLLFEALSLIQESRYDLFHGYLAVSSAFVGGHRPDLANGQPTFSIATNQVFPQQVTDPSWIKTAADPVRPYLSEHPHPFLKGYVIENPNVCRSTSVDLLIVIHSAVQNFQKRRFLRETWAAGNAIGGMSVKRIFALGRRSPDNGIQVRVNTEQASFGDIVQGNFVDSFPNLSRKAITIFRWINEHCIHARFVLKTDDDVFVNIFSLMETYLQRVAGEKRTVMCHVKAANTTTITRQRGSKWFVPNNVLSGRTHWPTFCSGYMVVMTTDVVPALYRVSVTAPYVPVDDGYVYGVLPSVAGNGFLQYIDITSNLTVNPRKMLSHYQNVNGSSPYLAGVVSDEMTMVKLWQATLARLSPWALRRSSIARLLSNMISDGT